MKIFILDDDKNILKIIEQIIVEKQIGNVTGTFTDSIECLEEVKLFCPDIIIIDLLMPELDGITFIEKVKLFSPDTKFIMISQVVSKDMIASAYEKGTTFYINKPINAVEILNVLKEVIRHIEIEKKLKSIGNIINVDENLIKKQITKKERVENILKNIGIIGNSSTRDIVEVVLYMLDNYKEVKDLSTKEICTKFSNNPKTLEQKIRRIANNGLENLAYLGIEDNLNNIFIEYSNTLYNFKDIKLEMDYIRDISNVRGKVNIRKFLDGIQFYTCEK